MTKFGLLVMICIGGAIGGLNLRAPTASPAAAPAPADDESSCSGATVSEDAASCATGGWVATGTCCAGAFVQERWTLNGRTKCCGACFL